MSKASRAPVLRLHHEELIVDNFAGGGGASLGIELGLGRSPDVAINHDSDAIAMHAANHPRTRHYCEDVWKVDPREACRGRHVALAWFSPDCKHFSKAKGGRPVDKKIRGLAWVVIRWAKAVRPRVICLENVEEFEDWGPLTDEGKPDPLKRGLTFRIWKGKLEALGYKAEHRELVAADYGTPTTRKRLFLVARRDGLPIVWPDRTHGQGMPLAWRSAAECIDFSIRTYSIFLTPEEAKPYRIIRPLAENTMRRVARGYQKFVVDNPNPYIVGVGGRMGQSPARGVDRPMQTLTAKLDAALTVPYVARIGQTGGNGDYVRAVGRPVSTITSKAEHLIVAPHLAKFRGDSPGSSIDAPVPTITAGPKERPAGAAHALGLIAPYMVPRYGERAGQEPRSLTVEAPMPTIVPSKNGASLVAAFLAKHNGGHEATGQLFGEPLHTVVARENKALVASSLVKLKGTAKDGQQLDLPLSTVQAGGNHLFETRAFLMKYYGPDQDPRLEDPLHTITSRDRHGLVLVHGEPYVTVDIGMRMLAPRELYRAQGFPEHYIIDPVVDGRRLPKDAQVRCVGNSVCPPVAAALARAQFEDQVIEVAA